MIKNAQFVALLEHTLQCRRIKNKQTQTGCNDLLECFRLEGSASLRILLEMQNLSPTPKSRNHDGRFNKTPR